MADPYLSISSSAGTVALNEISAGSDSGLEAGPGATGFGLPPVEAQFAEVPGDGAKFRYKRVGQRNIDMVIQAAGADRDACALHFGRLASVLAPGKVTLHWHDPDKGTEWRLECVHVGGGDYATGFTGDDRSMALSITLQSTDPFWYSDTPQVVNAPAPEEDQFSMVINNPGDKGALPVWTIEGPTLGWTAVSEAGEVLSFTGYIPKGVSVTIDCLNGTVVDSSGNNCYGMLGLNPKFFELPPGNSQVDFFIDRTSTDFQSAGSAPWYNLVTNPEFVNGFTGYTQDGAQIVGSQAHFRESNIVTTEPHLTVPVSGLIVGQQYVASIGVRIDSRPMALGFSGQTRLGAKMQATNGAQVVSRTVSFRDEMAQGILSRYQVWFVATATTATMTFYPERKRRLDGTWIANDSFLERIFIGGTSGTGPQATRLDPAQYFSGATPDTAEWNYSWEGTAHASRSIAQVINPTDTTGFSTSVSLLPRRWMVF